MAPSPMFWCACITVMAGSKAICCGLSRLPVTFGGVTTLTSRALSYVGLGIQHILLGMDHLLFVLGLMLIVKDRWTLIKTISSFTVAHSITLAIATLGYASAPLPHSTPQSR